MNKKQQDSNFLPQEINKLKDDLNATKNDNNEIKKLNKQLISEKDDLSESHKKSIQQLQTQNKYFDEQNNKLIKDAQVIRNEKSTFESYNTEKKLLNTNIDTLRQKNDLLKKELNESNKIKLQYLKYIQWRFLHSDKGDF